MLGLSKVARTEIRQQVVDLLANVCPILATAVAENVGVQPPAKTEPVQTDQTSPAVSQLRAPKKTTYSKKVAVIVDDTTTDFPSSLLEAEDIQLERVSIKQGKCGEHTIDHTLDTTSPVLYDGIIVAATFNDSVNAGKLQQFIDETYHHYKPIANLTDKPLPYVTSTGISSTIPQFIKDLAETRHWARKDAQG